MRASLRDEKEHKVTPSNGLLSKGLTLGMLGLIAAFTLLMAFAPSGSIYQG